MSVTDSQVTIRAARPETATDETGLVIRAQSDRSAFAPLYARYADPVYRYCYRRLGEADASADATSQIFIKAMTALPGCNPEKFRSWLFAIAHNVTIDAIRGRRPQGKLDDFPEHKDEQPGPEEVLVRSDEGKRLREIMMQLPPDQQRILELRLAGFTTIEIAETLGRSRGAIDTAQCRALQRLRAIMTPDHITKREQTNVSE
jgi:RNA polymerase sigma factor (sigma-70 family)